MKHALAVLALLAPSLVAADLKPLDEAGYARLLAAAKGKVVLVNFWATYCVPCRKEMPQMVALAAKLRPQGLQFVTISADEPEQLKDAAAFLDKVQVQPPVYLRKAADDDKFVSSIDPKWSGALPATFLYDRTGRKVRAFFGELKMAELESAIRKLL